MFLKSLTVKGFKSFAETTVLDFEPGVTVVVGPNGSGKSNIVDAVAWVLGAQGPRTVRSSKMEDVIFAGTPKRPALGRAEVSLTIDNTAGLLPIDFSEVTITRTLWRSGDSEYAINGVPCRLLDIQELLSDTGVGRQQHVIVSQGNIDAILDARPEERRFVIEEAAGILKYRRRKERAERRLESTEASLLRLQDLQREVRRQLRPLEKQAEAARRHDGVAAELSAVRKHLFGKEVAGIEARLSDAARRRREEAGAEGDLRGALARLDADVLVAETEVGDSGTEDLSELISRAEGLRARSAGLSALISERKRSIERAIGGSMDRDVIASLEAEAAALKDQLRRTDKEASGLLPEADALESAESAVAAEADNLDREWGSHPVPVSDAAAEARGELAAMRNSLERASNEAKRLDSSVASVAERTSRLSSQLGLAKESAAAESSTASSLAADEESAREAETRAESAHYEAERALRAAQADHHRWEARAEALALAIEDARARAGAEHLAGVAGVVGTLMELVDVTEGFEAAFEAAAGEVLGAVLLDGPSSAREALSRLRHRSRPGSVVALPPGRRTSEDLPDVAGTEPVRRQVRSWLPSVEAFLDDLLVSAVVTAGGWPEALDIALSRPDLVVVTRDGDRFAGGLWRCGTSGAGATASALEEARQRAGIASEGVDRAALALSDASNAASLSRDRHVEAVRRVEANVAALRSLEDTAVRLAEELAEAERSLESFQSQSVEVAGRLDLERARIAELETALPELEREADASSQKATAERAARYRLAERAAEVAAMRREIEVKAAGLQERRALTTQRLAEVEERLRRDTESRATAAERRQRAERAREVADRLTEGVRSRQHQLNEALAALREARHRQVTAAQEASRRLEGLRRQRAAAERQLAETRERASRAEIDAAEAKVRLEALTEAVRRDVDCEVEAVRSAECPPLPPGTSASSRRSELERELRLMGPINPLALEEHSALQERHQFLEAQLEDVKAARRELAKVIRAIDIEIVDVFGAAYADVADHFEKLFATLFPGGEGRLRLTEPERPLDTGIEVEARPSGKNFRRLSLLSGGERSLVAMAFLFAVFRARPSPFYMLDEVEAALDDVNLHRFLDLIHEFREEAQLLIVSHQKRTMEAADCLYGVTMAPGTSSRVVSERVTAPAG